MTTKGGQMFTSDGKKVVVIGKLNATDTIVQEVFVKEDGSEIPSGEQFITKSLHAERVVSWAEKESEKIEARLKSLKAEHDDAARRMRIAMGEATARIRALKLLAANAAEEQIQTLEAFVSGEITHVVVSRYGESTITPFDAILSAGKEYPEEVRLLSLYGRCDGRLDWKISDYHDGSGGSTTVVPACGLDDAKRIQREVFDARVNEWRSGKGSPPKVENYTTIECDKKVQSEIEVPEDVKAWRRAKAAEEVEQEIARLEKLLEDARKRQV